jgi:hypothetical protein
MSRCSYVTSLSSYVQMSFIATFLSSCSILTSTAVSPIYCTESANLFPASWTTLICSSAWAFHVLTSFCLVSMFARNPAWPRTLATTCSRKLCTSWICEFTNVWHWYTSWHQPQILAKRSVIEAEPCYKECCKSLLRCPSWACVSWASACN